jgi:hypothetical protein
VSRTPQGTSDTPPTSPPRARWRRIPRGRECTPPASPKSRTPRDTSSRREILPESISPRGKSCRKPTKLLLNRRKRSLPRRACIVAPSSRSMLPAGKWCRRARPMRRTLRQSTAHTRLMRACSRRSPQGTSRTPSAPPSSYPPDRSCRSTHQHPRMFPPPRMGSRSLTRRGQTSPPNRECSPAPWLRSSFLVESLGFRVQG